MEQYVVISRDSRAGRNSALFGNSSAETQPPCGFAVPVVCDKVLWAQKQRPSADVAGHTLGSEPGGSSGGVPCPAGGGSAAGPLTCKVLPALSGDRGPPSSPEAFEPLRDLWTGGTSRWRVSLSLPFIPAAELSPSDHSDCGQEPECPLLSPKAEWRQAGVCQRAFIF